MTRLRQSRPVVPCRILMAALVLVACAGTQALAQQHARGLVIDHHDVPHAARYVLKLWPWLGRVARQARQEDVEHGACAGRGVHADGTAVLRHNSVDNGEAHACAFIRRFRREERIEGAVQYI